MHCENCVAILMSNFSICYFRNENETPWLKEKRTYPYRNPCASESKDVSTSTLDTSSCKDCSYIPKTLKQVTCRTNNSLKNARGKTSCKHVSGDCVNIHTTISVEKKFPNGVRISRDVVLKVGCACMLLQ